MSAPILFVTPNPSIDKVAVVHGYRTGQIHRPEQLVRLAGGKGLNAARAARLLGADTRVCILVAGHSGRWIVAQLAADGVPTGAAWAEGETRTCTVVVDPRNGRLTELYEAGDTVSAAAWERFERACHDALSGVALAVFSGSLPPGAPPDGYARLIRMAHQQGIRACLDTHGQPLALALDATPDMVKMNQHEAGELLGTSLRQPRDAVLAARRLVGRGLSVVAITMGGRGAVAVSSAEAWYARPPHVDAVATVGSGDAFMGAFAWAMVQQAPLAEALRAATAAGAANTLTLGPGVIERSVFGTLTGQVLVTARQR